MDQDGQDAVTVVEAASDPVRAVLETVGALLADDLAVLVTGPDADALGRVAAELPAPPAADPPSGPHAWLPLPVRGDCPLTSDDLRRLVVLESRHTLERERRSRQRFPDEDEVPTADEVRDLADRSARAMLAARQLDPSLRDLLDRPDADDLLQAIRDLNARLGDVLGRGRPWVVRAADRALADPGASTWAELAGQAGSIDRVIAAYADLRGTRIENATTGDAALRAISALADRLADGEQLKRRFRSRVQRAAAPYLDGVLVDGEPVTDVAGVAAVRTHLEAWAQTAALEAELAPLGVPVPADGPRETVVAELLGIREALRAVDHLVEAARRLDELLASSSGAAAAFELRSLDDVDRVRWAGDALTAVRDGELARREMEAAARTLAESGEPAGQGEGMEPAPELAELALCLRAGDATAYAEWLGKLEVGRRTHRLATLRSQLRDRLAAAAPGLVAQLDADSAEETWAPRIAQWPQAWEWAREASEQLPPAPPRVLGLDDLVADRAQACGVDVVVLHDPAGKHVEDQRLRGLAPRTVVVTEPTARPEVPATSEAPVPPATPADPRDVVLALADRGPVSGAEVRAATGLSAARARTLLKRLVDDGELVRTGATSATRWHRPAPE
ncbi:hypothetical protein [Nocardioides ferulae]|uniref:hypothetical protein n=1 Tax=Nocardioides ferulae TaxID=2340821 RepID=UPI000EB0FCCC|nr:hypothetical protein [Nocardioides ferulae]